MGRRNLAVSGGIAASFCVTASVMAVVIPSERSPSVWALAAIVIAYAVASRVEFEVGAGAAVPTEIVLVPMLFLLPIGQVPLWVAAGYLLGEAPSYLRRRAHVEKSLILLCCSWHAVGPALVLALAGARPPQWRDAPIYVVALLAQFSFDAASSILRDRAVHGIPVATLAHYLAWVYLVDLVLAPVGLLIAFAVVPASVAIVLTLPLIAFIAMFARERRARIDHALELRHAYRGTGRLAQSFHEILSEDSRDASLARIADTLAELVPYDCLAISERGNAGDVPLLVRGELPDDPDVAMIHVPLPARRASAGDLRVYRTSAPFAGNEEQIVRWFADAAALSLDNARIRHALEQRASTDSLTGVLNRGAFQERLAAAVAALADGARVTLLMLDVDNFKRVNDTYGHAAGDDVLTTLARILRDLARVNDAICRIGGEEFAVIMLDADAVGAVAFSERLRVRLEATGIDPVGTITVSIGIVEGRLEPPHTAGQVAAEADAAMMWAKALGKNRVAVYDPASPPPHTGPHSGGVSKLLRDLMPSTNTDRRS